MKFRKFAINFNDALIFLVNPLIGLLTLVAATSGWLFLARLLFLLFLFLTFTSFILGLSYLHGRSRAGAWIAGAAFFYSLFIFFAYGQHILVYDGFFHFMMVTIHPNILIGWAIIGLGCGVRTGVLLNVFSIFKEPK